MNFKGRHFLYLFLLAFSLRILYFAQIGQSPFFFPSPGLDPFLYHQWAKSIAMGKGMGKDVFQAMPLYPYFLGLIYKIAAPGLFWAKLLQLFLGALSVLFVYRIGSILFSAKVGGLAALAQAFSGISIFYEELLLPTALISFLFITTMFLLLLSAERQSWGCWSGAGLCLALSALANAGVLLFLPFLLIWIFFYLPGSFGKKSLIFGILLLCTVSALSAVFIRNLVVARDPVLLTAHGGINFYIGNHEGATGRFQSLFSQHTASEQLLQESREAAEKEAGHALTASEASQFWVHKGINFVRHHPAEYLKLFFKKLFLFWNGYEIPDVADYYFFRSRFLILKYFGIPLGWLIPWAILGIFVGLRLFRRLFLLYGFLLSQMGAILLIFVNSRYRAPLVFVLSLFAAFALSWCYDLFKEKRYRTLLVVSCFLIHLFFLAHVDVGGSDEVLEEYNRGISLDHAGEHKKAVEAFEKALVMYPEDGAVLFGLANALFRQGNFSEARRRYGELVLLQPDHADSCFNLGLLEFQQGRLDEAEKLFQRSNFLKRDQPDVYYLLSVIYRKKGLLQKAEEAKRRSIALGADPVAVEKDPEKTFVR